MMHETTNIKTEIYLPVCHLHPTVPQIPFIKDRMKPGISIITMSMCSSSMFTILELLFDDAVRTFYVILAFEERYIDTGVKYVSCNLKPFLGGAGTKVSKKIKSVFSQPNRTLLPKPILS